MSGKAVRETLAALGVIASLVFVGTEIRQNRLVAQAQAIQAYSALSIQMHESLYSDPDLRRDYYDWLSSSPDEVPTYAEQATSGVYLFVRALLRFHESVFLQVQRGLFDEQDLGLYAFRNQTTYESAAFPFYWQTIRRGFNADFVLALERDYNLAP